MLTLYIACLRNTLRVGVKGVNIMGCNRNKNCLKFYIFNLQTKIYIYT